MLSEIKAAYERRQAAYERRVLVCGGAGCVSCHCQAVRDALEEAVEALGLGGRVRVMVTGCIGICAVGPVMVVEPDGVLYTSLDPERAALIAAATCWKEKSWRNAPSTITIRSAASRT